MGVAEIGTPIGCCETSCEDSLVDIGTCDSIVECTYAITDSVSDPETATKFAESGIATLAGREAGHGAVVSEALTASRCGANLGEVDAALWAKQMQSSLDNLGEPALKCELASATNALLVRIAPEQAMAARASAAIAAAAIVRTSVSAAMAVHEEYKSSALTTQRCATGEHCRIASTAAIRETAARQKVAASGG